MERRSIPRSPVLMSGAIEFAGSTINCLIRNISIWGGRRSMLLTPTTSPSVSALSSRLTARTFPVTSSGAKRSGSAWPSTNTRRPNIERRAVPALENIRDQHQSEHLRKAAAKYLE
jgi:hypothetical protein